MRAIRHTAAMSSTFDADHYERLADQHAPVITEMIEELERANAQQIQALGDALRTYCETHDLGYFDVVHHSQAGVREGNRNGEMILPARVYTLLAIILLKGWCARETLLALAVEIDHGADGEVTRQKNLQLVERSAGMLAPLRAEALRIATGVGSHTTALLRAVDFAEPGARIDCGGNKDLEHVCQDGYLSKARVLQECTSMKGPILTGLRYFIIRRQIHKRVPALMEVLSESDNAKHDNYQVESFLQTMLNIHARSVVKGAATTKEWEAIVRAVSRSHGPAFRHDAACYAEYVREHSGGFEKPFLLEIDSQMKGLPLIRNVAPEMFRDFAKVVAPLHGYYITAMVKAAIAAPEAFVKGGVAKLFTPQDLALIPSASVDVAQKIMVEARTLRDSSPALAEIPAAQRALHDMDVRLVMHVHKKIAPNRKTFPTMMHIACDCFCELLRCHRQGNFPAKLSPCPWVAVEVAAAPAKAKAKSLAALPVALRESAVSGIATRVVCESRGYTIGVHVRAPRDGRAPQDGQSIFEIRAMSDDAALLSGDGGNVGYEQLLLYIICDLSGTQVFQFFKIWRRALVFTNISACMHACF